MPRFYERWLEEDVRWIITPDERAAFLRLAQNEERDNFIEQFWIRRDPTSGGPQNTFKEEHYRRIAYANVHFQWQAVPGWKTDRGRTYIVFGPPDAIKDESDHDSSGSLTLITGPTQLWHYHSMGNDEAFRFVDVCGCGDFRLEGRTKKIP